MRFSRRFIHSCLTSAAWWSGVAISLVLHLLVAQIVEDKGRAQFEYQANNAQVAIQTRVQSYMDVLRGAAALFYTHDAISREQFHSYVKQLHLEEGFPGIRNLNFAQHLPAVQKNSFELAVRADTSVDPQGYPRFETKPNGNRPHYHVLTYLEPMHGNARLLGFDLASVPDNAEALAFARDNDQLISSGRTVNINGPDQHAGLAMRIPLYRRGMPIRTVEQRRAAFYGSVGASYDVNQLLRGAVDANTLRSINLRLYDAGGVGHPAPVLAAGITDPAQLLYESDAADSHHVRDGDMRALFVKRVRMTVGPRLWEAEFSASKSAMMGGFERYLPWIVLATGVLGSVLLYSIYYSLISARRRAVELAGEMTKDLRDSEASLAEAQHMAQLGSWVLEPESGKMTWSAETYRLFGLDSFVRRPGYDDFLNRIHPEDRGMVRDGLRKSITTGKELNIEHRIVRPDRTVRWVHAIARPGHQDRNILRGTLMDISERKQTVEALKRSQELLRDLTAHQDRVKEDERKRIAREIHDELGQTLLALRIDVSMLDARTAKSHPRLNERVRDALNQLDATVKTIRTIINNLRPSVLDLGLTAAIEWQVNEFRRRSGIACELVLSDTEYALDDERATTLFRILQESLTNVIRHANANRVLIELYRDGNRLVMKITDNGVGIYPERRKCGNSFGLIGVEERVHALHGEFRIDSAPGHGTVLTVFIPMETGGKRMDTRAA
jgi:signal transduction histidine kinase/CHASE1-domain containing sensor protein